MANVSELLALESWLREQCGGAARYDDHTGANLGSAYDLAADAIKSLLGKLNDVERVARSHKFAAPMYLHVMEPTAAVERTAELVRDEIVAALEGARP